MGVRSTATAGSMDRWGSVAEPEVSTAVVVFLPPVGDDVAGAGQVPDDVDGDDVDGEASAADAAGERSGVAGAPGFAGWDERWPESRSACGVAVAHAAHVLAAEAVERAVGDATGHRDTQTGTHGWEEALPGHVVRSPSRIASSASSTSTAVWPVVAATASTTDSACFSSPVVSRPDSHSKAKSPGALDIDVHGFDNVSGAILDTDTVHDAHRGWER